MAASSSSGEVEEAPTFESTGSGASATFPMQCSACRKGGYIVINGRPCKIVDMSTSKTGKHGHAKVHVVALDIFTAKKMEDICPSTHNVDVPNVSRAEFTVVDITDEGFLSLLNQDGTTKDDLKLPAGELADQLKEAFGTEKEVVVSVLKAMGEEMVMSFKVGT
jgi:translation initiation factor 5A